jgi:hypothetical protein
LAKPACSLRNCARQQLGSAPLTSLVAAVAGRAHHSKCMR